MGAIVHSLNGQQFGNYVRAELAKWGDAVKTAGIKPE